MFVELNKLLFGIWIGQTGCEAYLPEQINIFEPTMEVRFIENRLDIPIRRWTSFSLNLTFLKQCTEHSSRCRVTE